MLPWANHLTKTEKILTVIGLSDYEAIAGFAINGISYCAFFEIHIFCRREVGRAGVNNEHRTEILCQVLGLVAATLGDRNILPQSSQGTRVQ